MDGHDFTAFMESPGGYHHPNVSPYMDGAKTPVPTIGIGMSLNDFSTANVSLNPSLAVIKMTLATDVRRYYLTVYGKNLSSSTDDQIIDMLKKNAGIAKATKTTAPPALTVADAQNLYDLRYAVAVQDAMDYAGPAWTSLMTTAQIALTDLAYNVGRTKLFSQFTGLRGAIQNPLGPDYLLAGFELIDAARTSQVGYARVLADYEYLVAGSTLLTFS